MATHGDIRWPPPGTFDGRLRGDFHGRRHLDSLPSNEETLACAGVLRVEPAGIEPATSCLQSETGRSLHRAGHCVFRLCKPDFAVCGLVAMVAPEAAFRALGRVMDTLGVAYVGVPGRSLRDWLGARDAGPGSACAAADTIPRGATPAAWAASSETSVGAVCLLALALLALGSAAVEPAELRLRRRCHVEFPSEWQRRRYSYSLGAARVAVPGRDCLVTGLRTSGEPVRGPTPGGEFSSARTSTFDAPLVARAQMGGAFGPATGRCEL